MTEGGDETTKHRSEEAGMRHELGNPHQHSASQKR